MDRVRDDFLPHPALAGDEDGGIGPGNAADQLVNILHRRGTADDEVVGGLRGDDGIGFRAVLGEAHLLRGGEGALGDAAQLEVHRLAAQHVKGSQAHRLDHGVGRVDAAVEDDHRIGLGHADALQELDPVEGAHLEFGDEKVGAAVGKQFQGLIRGAGRHDLDGLGFEVPGGPLEEIGIVVRDNDRLFLQIFHIGLTRSEGRTLRNGDACAPNRVRRDGGQTITQSRPFTDFLGDEIRRNSFGSLYRKPRPACRAAP